MKSCPSSYNCPVEATLDLIGGKYKALILWHLIDNILRFNEISKLIPQATPKMLTQQLRELEADQDVYKRQALAFADFMIADSYHLHN